MSDAAPQLFIVTPVLEDASAFLPMLGEALAAADVACLLVRCGSVDDGAVKRIFKQVAAVAQPRGTACLLPEASRLSARVDADGVHLDSRAPDFEGRLGDALESAGGKRIVGVGGLVGRDAAMTAGERDVDYLMFGDETADPDATVETVAWWAEIFNVPCVGFVSRLAMVPEIVAAGAEFVALGDALWLDPRGPATVLSEVGHAIAGVVPVEG